MPNEFDDLTLSDIKVEGKPLETVVTPAPEAAPEVTPAATTVEPAPAEPAAVTPEKVEPVKVDAPAQVEPAKVEPAPVPEYKFKDDFIKGAVEYYEKTGDFTPYIQAKSIDFTKLSDEEIMRYDLKHQNPKLSDKAIDALFKESVADKFKIDEETHGRDASEIGREFLKLEADKKREKFIEEQKAFKAPETAEDVEAREYQELVAKTLKEFEEATRGNAETKAILESKKLALKVGESEVNFEVSDPNSLLDMTLDNQKFFSQFQNSDKSIDYKRWYKVLAYSQNPDLYEKTLFDSGKAEGREEITKEIKNPTNAGGGDVPTEGEGDFTTGLLNAFKTRGVHK